MTQDIKIISSPVEEVLTERQQADYRSFKEAFVQWMSKMGKTLVLPLVMPTVL